MKADIRFWPDTGDLDIKISADTETEFAALGLLRERKAVIYEGGSSEDRSLTIGFQSRNRGGRDAMTERAKGKIGKPPKGMKVAGRITLASDERGATAEGYKKALKMFSDYVPEKIAAFTFEIYLGSSDAD